MFGHRLYSLMSTKQEIKTSADHGAKFRGDRPTELADPVANFF